MAEAEEDGTGTFKWDEGASYWKPVFAFRGSSAGVELKTKHRKYATNMWALPSCGAEGREAVEAYAEFLEGLDLINQQEEVPKDKEIGELLRWERQVKVRANARSARLFDENLRRRVRKGMHTPPQECAQNEWPIRDATRNYLTRPMEKDFSLAGAAAYLFACAVYIMNVVSQCTQISQVCSVGYICPSGSLTSGFPIVAPPPHMRNISFQTVSAKGTSPTVSLANSSTGTTVSKAFWRPVVKTNCAFGECDTPGYEVQWPYMQSEETTCNAQETYDICNGTGGGGCTGERAACAIPFKYDGNIYTDCTTHHSSNLKPWCSLASDYDDPANAGRWGHCNTCKGEGLRVPAELLDDERCDLIVQGDRGWVWDPFLADLRSEYLDCGETERIPFKQKLRMKGQDFDSPMHFDPTYYADLHDKTRKCMEATRRNIPVSATDPTPLLSSISEWPLLDYDQQANALAEMRPLSTFYAKQGTPTHRCRGGKDAGQLCFPGALVGGSTGSNECRLGSCERTFEKQHSLSLSSRFGCWFAHPEASEMLAAEYHACGVAPRLASRGQVDADNAKYQAAVNVHISGITRRTGLLLLFLLKEGNYLTAAVFVIAVLLALLPLILLIGAACCAYYLTAVKGSDVKHARFVNTLLMIFNLVYGQIVVLAVMCVNFSTIYRVYKLLAAVVVRQVNSSIKDMDRKMTGLANTVYGLVLIFVTGSNPDTGLVSSLILSLVLLLKQMNEEKLKLQQIARPLKDFNENRLSTFEVALLWTKVLEDFLDDDVQYNWVQAFRVREPLRPVFREHTGRSLGEEREAGCCQTLSHVGRELKDFITETARRHWEASASTESRDELYLQPLEPDLANKFGHDGKGIFSQGDVQSPKTIEGDDTHILLVGDGSQRLETWATETGNSMMRAEAVRCLQKRWARQSTAVTYKQAMTESTREQAKDMTSMISTAPVSNIFPEITESEAAGEAKVEVDEVEVNITNDVDGWKISPDAEDQDLKADQELGRV